jgi:hypothetical protein
LSDCSTVLRTASRGACRKREGAVFLSEWGWGAALGIVCATTNGMATKAETYRAEVQRQNQASHPKRTSSKAKAASHGSHKDGVSGTAARNLKTAESHVKDGPALEDSATGKPSRKSTRGSSGHIKLATNLQRRQVRRVHSPEARAARSAVQR